MYWESEVVESGGQWQTALDQVFPLFLGSYEHALDEKGRVSLPARFREALAGEGDPRLILTTNVDPGGTCLVAYPLKEWQAFHERISGLPQFDEAVIQLKRLHVAGACECTPDRQGRILIPAVLREYAGLRAEVLFAGLGSSIEIWDKASWEDVRRRAKQNLSGINEAIARLGL